MGDWLLRAGLPAQVQTVADRKEVEDSTASGGRTDMFTRHRHGPLYACDLCQYGTRWTVDFAKHMKVVHEEDIQGILADLSQHVSNSMEDTRPSRSPEQQTDKPKGLSGNREKTNKVKGCLWAWRTK
jgi:hypothetical protein